MEEDVLSLHKKEKERQEEEGGEGRKVERGGKVVLEKVLEDQ